MPKMVHSTAHKNVNAMMGCGVFFSGEPRATRALAAAHKRVCATCGAMPVLNTARPTCQPLDVPKHVTNAALRRDIPFLR